MFKALLCMFGKHSPDKWHKIPTMVDGGLDYYYKQCTACGYVVTFLWQFQDEDPPD